MNVLRAMNFAPTDRVIVVHVDDLGMSHPANIGGVQALDGAATCGSVMMPCPGFDEIAHIANDRPELDLGVHLTMNCEFPGFRWGPACDDVPSLCRPDGTLLQTARETVANAKLDEIAREIRTQIDGVLDAGIDATHIDTHMGTLFDRRFFQLYLQAGLDYNLPISLPQKISPGLLAEHGLRLPEGYDAQLAHMRGRGFPVFDYIEGQTPWYNPFTAEFHQRARLQTIPEGLTYFVIHAAEGSDDLKAFAPDWLQRHEEYRLFSDGTMEGAMDDAGIKRIGMRELREYVRRGG